MTPFWTNFWSNLLANLAAVVVLGFIGYVAKNNIIRGLKKFIEKEVVESLFVIEKEKSNSQTQPPSENS